jgi:hypothetical protein
MQTHAHARTHMHGHARAYVCAPAPTPSSFSCHLRFCAVSSTIFCTQRSMLMLQHSHSMLQHRTASEIRRHSTTRQRRAYNIPCCHAAQRSGAHLLTRVLLALLSHHIRCSCDGDDATKRNGHRYDHGRVPGPALG